LQKYDFKIVHAVLPGNSIPVADTLSHTYLPEEYPELCEGLDVHADLVVASIPIRNKTMNMTKTATESDTKMKTQYSHFC
jgi:hypothetical protein